MKTQNAFKWNPSGVLFAAVLGYLLSTDLAVAQHEEVSENQILKAIDIQTTLGAWAVAGPDYYVPGPKSVNLNLVTAEQLQEIPGTTPAGIAAILKYKNLYGRFTEVSELNAVEGLSTQEAQALAPFLRVEPLELHFPSAKELFGPKARPFILTRAQSQWPRADAYSRPDFATNRVAYAGDPWGATVRVRGGIPQQFTYNLVLDKDPGEALVPPGGKGPKVDYVSGNVVFYNQNRLKTLAIGDYQLAFGQGIAFGRAFVLGRGADPVLTLAPNSPGILPYQALVEGRALRGVAATYQLAPSLFTSVFGSKKRVDAASAQASDSLAAAAADAVGPPRYAGLHRTASELEARQSLPENLGGAALVWKPSSGFGQVGALIARQEYGKAFSSDAAAKGFATSQTYGSLWYRSRVGSAAFSGEATLRQGVQPAFIQTVQWLPTGQTGLGLQVRHLPTGAEGSYGQPVAQSIPTAGGEQGIMLAATQRVGKWQWAHYQDYFQPTQPTAATPLPTPITEWALQGLYTASQTNDALLQIRARKTLLSGLETGGSPNALPAGTSLHTVLGARIQALPRINLAGQVRLCTVPTATGRVSGWAAYQQAQIRLGWLQATLRAYVFETDGYAARLVFYEPGVLYTPKAQSCYGRGTRFMALFNLRIPKAGNIYLKLARTQPQAGPATTELTVQARWWLNGTKNRIDDNSF
jgi:hypothetical protein